MGTPFLSEIKIVTFDFAPKNWAQCNGQLMSIQQNAALFSLLGTTYGGNGTTNFALPNMQGRTPLHFGNGYTQGQLGGEQNHTLAISEIPAHNHIVTAISTANTGTNVVNPNGQFLATSTPATLYNSSGANLTTLAANTVSNTGGSQGHQNMQPYLTLNFCIAIAGYFPSRN
jgi:microcystin-dependent protein